MKDPERLADGAATRSTALGTLLKAARTDVPDPGRVQDLTTAVHARLLDAAMAAGHASRAGGVTAGVAGTTGVASIVKYGAAALLVAAGAAWVGLGGGWTAEPSDPMRRAELSPQSSIPSARGVGVGATPAVTPVRVGAVPSGAAPGRMGESQREGPAGGEQSPSRVPQSATLASSRAPAPVSGATPHDVVSAREPPAEGRDDLGHDALSSTGTPPDDPRSVPVPSSPGAPPAEPTEVDLLRSAEAQLRTSPAAALALADEHAARFPSGMLAQEREVIAIEALVGLGRKDDARARAVNLLRAAPTTAHRHRIEALVGALPAEAVHNP